MDSVVIFYWIFLYNYYLMIFRETFKKAEEHIIETYDEDHKSRPPRLAALERKLHNGFTSWTADHKSRYPKMGRLPYRPDIFTEQRIDRPFSPVNSIARIIARNERSNKPTAQLVRPAIHLGRLAYQESIKKAHAKTVGSEAVSAMMIAAFLNTPADENRYGSATMIEFVADRLDQKRDITVGLTSAHLRELADIGEFSGALNIALAEVYGFRYIDRVNTLINNNMTRQTYRVGKVPVPISWLMRTGTGIFWGVPPGDSAQKHGIGKEELMEANRQVSEAFIQEKRKHGMVFAYVPSGSGAIRETDEATGELKRIRFRDASYTAPLSVRCRGGIIPVNREGEKIAIGSVIPVEKPVSMNKKDYENLLTDRIMEEHAAQAEELTGVPAEFARLYRS